MTVGRSVAGLLPLECGRCHENKLIEWRGSLHAGSLSPGLRAQLHPIENPAFAESCYLCHAPAVEQKERIRGPDGFKKNPGFNRDLQETGVSCAVCHMRSGTVFGPVKPAVMGGKGLHRSAEEPLFNSSEFCAACHQLDSGFELNGRPLTNTYHEWKDSPYAKENVTCQGCHMPGARHLFRGIHDAETVRGGLDFELKKEAVAKRVTLMITNARIGHYFPTYITPLIVIRGFLLNEDGSPDKESVREAKIGRMVSLDLSREEFDTRIAPRENFEFIYKVREGASAGVVRIEVEVFPDEFYNRFYKAALSSNATGYNMDDLMKALKESEESAYMLYEAEVEF
jgi:hypothetical protein